MNRPDWFPPPTVHPANGETLCYPLDELRAGFDVRECGPGWLVLKREETWLRWAVCEFAMSEGDGSDVQVSVAFYGDGPGGTKAEGFSLRECRHTYWGEDGYIFYPNGKLITAALEALGEFYDLD